MSSELPSHHRALVLETVEAGFQLKRLPTSIPDTGSAIIRVLHVGVLSYAREIYNGERNYPYPKPLVGGFSAIARVAAIGPDSVLLQPGQLVWFDCVVRGRDDPNTVFLTALHEGMSDGSRKLMRGVWRDGTFAEFAKVPLENCVPLNETRLCHELGYSLQDLTYLSYLLVPYGGLRDIKLEPGETIIVAPATGGFGGAAVQVAVSMGARVIAMGRNEKELARLKEHIKTGNSGAHVETVKMTGDENTDTAALQAFGKVDAVFDTSPPAAYNSTHLKSAITALRRGGRCSMMGYVGYQVDWKIMADEITLKGKFMYDRGDMLQFIKMMETGLFPSGKAFVDIQAFELGDWKEAFDAAAEHIGIGKLVVLSP